ncbi:hypothetical protein BO71DRAFT_439518 [Aspergillus ellipticus CBS 707.79]|uniref:MOSC domain-containing protein n=1 Tax=Aspergillus ellipticus CBS 707.79 TaxID=1448320 RepID=A0A319DGN4_9EURO|nr:hypothetical protein BO71DRAFT_439518 [Aspergillus ellipticus CBS 707.79]
MPIISSLISTLASKASVNHDLTLPSSPWPYIVSFIIITLTLLLPHLKSPPSYTPPGCRKLGLPRSKSNLNDEFAPEYAHGASSTSKNDSNNNPNSPPYRIKALFTYPIKSCTGVELDTAEVIETGLKYDRLFSFAEFIENPPSSLCADAQPAPPSSTPQTGEWIARTLRNRTFNTLALLTPEIWIPDPSSPTYAPDLPSVQSSGVLLLKYPRVSPSPLTSLLVTLHLLPDHLALPLPLTPPPTKVSDFPLTPIKIWKDSPLAYDYGHLIPASLWTFLASGPESSPAPTSKSKSTPQNKRKLTLFRSHPHHPREIFRCAPSKDDIGFQPSTGFADAYPLHLLNLASVRDVAEKCAAQIPRLSVRRFRANVIVTGPGRFEEDDWKRIFVPTSHPHGYGDGGNGDENGNGNGNGSGGDRVMDGNGDRAGVEIHTVCRTIRCQLPNVDPDTGSRHRNEPERTLRGYRCIDPGDKGSCLGMQLVPGVREFTLRVNDPISVLETGEHFYIKMLAPGEKVEGV